MIDPQCPAWQTSWQGPKRFHSDGPQLKGRDVALLIKVHRWSPRRDVQSKRDFSDLPGPRKDNGGLALAFQGGLHDLIGLTWIHTLQMLHIMKDLKRCFWRNSSCDPN